MSARGTVCGVCAPVQVSKDMQLISKASKVLLVSSINKRSVLSLMLGLRWRVKGLLTESFLLILRSG